jgi:tetratricopeptide (TPR) repeat protein
VKKPQLILAGSGLLLAILLLVFGKFVPEKAPAASNDATVAAQGPMEQTAAASIDTILFYAKKELAEGQLKAIEVLEKKLANATGNDPQMAVYHDLAHYWKDSIRIFEPYAFYEAESARLENSEKSLTFAARLFLENLQGDQNGSRRQWKALQAKDLYERSLKINPDNDSSKVGIGACYLFGNISTNPMEGIAMIREVVQRDSNNVYAQLTLVKGSMLSGQYDKGIERLLKVVKLEPSNTEAVLMLADLYERTGNKKGAIEWYGKSIPLIPTPEIQAAIRERIEELKK